MGYFCNRALFFLVLCYSSQVSAFSESEGVRRIRAHFLIEDIDSALYEAEELFQLFPESQSVGSAYLEALALSGLEEKALRLWDCLILIHPNLAEDRRLLEELAWGALRKGIDSTQHSVRLATLISAYLTKDVRALKVFHRMMKDPNAIVRSVAVQMATEFADASIKDEIHRLLVEEPVWFVRLDVIKAVGRLRLKVAIPELKAILTSEKNTFEERHCAVEALAEIYESIDLSELTHLASSQWSALRYLACILSSHFQTTGADKIIVGLCSDPHPSVRMAALNALGLVCAGLEIHKDALKILLEDTYPAVAITAASTMSFIQPEVSEIYFKRWLKSETAEDRHLAAAALISTGGRCSGLAQQILRESKDPYVKANIALGMIGQRWEVKRCCDILYDFICKEKQMWMWDNRQNPLFQVLMPSRVRHIHQIPNYPEAVDQLTRLQLISILALVEDPRAQEAMKKFIQHKGWGITGVAAAMLLREGSEGDFELIRGLLQDADPNVQLQACFVLAMLGHDESVEIELQKTYPQANYDQKLHILEALGYIGTVRSSSFFIKALQEPFQILRIISAAGLIQCLNR